MGEVVNVIVAFAVIVVIFRWITTSSESPEERSASSSLGFRPKNVTQDMVNTIHGMFPDIPADNIRYDLLRTGNVELTSNKILERGFLDAPPPAYFAVYPRTPVGQVAATGTNSSSSSSSKPKPAESLISRYQLEGRTVLDDGSNTLGGGKAVWEDSAEKREASLRERKAQMILAARERMLKQQANLSSNSLNRPKAE